MSVIFKRNTHLVAKEATETFGDYIHSLKKRILQVIQDAPKEMQPALKEQLLKLYMTNNQMIEAEQAQPGYQR